MKKRQQKNNQEYQNNLKSLLLELMPILSKKVENFNFLRFIDDFTRKNLPVKILSLIFAVIFSFYVSLQDVDERRIVVPLDIKISPNMTVASEIPKQMAIYVSGTRSALTDLDVNYVSAIVDLRERGEGAHDYKPLIKGLGESVRVIRLAPEKISVKISALKRKWIKVEPDFVHKVAKGYFLENYEIFPQKIFVSGPEEILNDLSSLKTEKISLKDIKVDKEVNVSLSAAIHPSIHSNGREHFKVRLFVVSKDLVKVIQDSFFIEGVFKNKKLQVVGKHFVTNVKVQIDRQYLDNFDAQKDLIFSFETANVVQAGQFQLKVRGNVEQYAQDKVKIISFSPENIFVEVAEKLIDSEVTTLKHSADDQSVARPVLMKNTKQKKILKNVMQE